MTVVRAGASLKHSVVKSLKLRETSGQRPHTTSPQKVAEEQKSPYFRDIYVGEILSFGQKPSRNCFKFDFEIEFWLSYLDTYSNQVT